eukprot:gene25395-41750_t
MPILYHTRHLPSPTHCHRRLPRPTAAKNEYGFDAAAYDAALTCAGRASGTIYTFAEMYQFNVNQSELLGSDLRRDSPGRPTCTVVMDMAGLHMAPHAPHWPVMDFVKMTGDVQEKNYPEILHKLYIVNANVVFATLWKMLKFFFAQEIRDKMHILGANYEEELLRQVDPAQLPSFLKGCTLPVHEDWAGDLEYLEHFPSHPCHIDAGLTTRAEVRHGATHRHHYRAADGEGEEVRWAFCTEHGDITFSVLGGSGEVLVAEARHDCANAPVSGATFVPSGGEPDVVTALGPDSPSSSLGASSGGVESPAAWPRG